MSNNDETFGTCFERLMYSVYDSALEQYTPPMTCFSEAEAKRSFAQFCLNLDRKIYEGVLSLVYMGRFNIRSGEFTTFQPSTVVVNNSEFYEGFNNANGN